MSQHDYVIENQTFPATRTDINNALAAVASTNAGSSAPSTTYAHQLWYDTTANKLKQRNADNDAWIDLFDVDQSTDTAGLSGDVTIAGDLTVDTTTLKVDSTNNRVGIGIASPATTLESKTTTSGAPATSGTTPANVALRLASTATTGIIDMGMNSSSPFIQATDSGDLSQKYNLALNPNGGNVGIGTSSPASALTVEKGNVTGAGQWASSAIALTNPTNIGAYSQIGFGYTPSQTNASSYIGYVSTNQGASGYGDLVFGTRAVNTDTQPTERMRITSGGAMLLATTTNLGSNARMSLRFDGGGTQYGLELKQDTDSTYAIAFRNSSSTFIGGLNTTASAVSLVSVSDYRLKENVTYDWDATTRLNQLKPARFNFIGEANTTVDGFLAHEVSHNHAGNPLVPDAVVGTKDAVDDDGNPVMQMFDQSKLVPLLVKTIQELEARITALEAS